jgi:hypothetical protein
MPGDEVVKCPKFSATRAVTAQARPEEISPWLVQIGITRAGWYSYDWLDNLGIPSAQRIIPELQHVSGSTYPGQRPGYLCVRTLAGSPGCAGRGGAIM